MNMENSFSCFVYHENNYHINLRIRFNEAFEFGNTAVGARVGNVRIFELAFQTLRAMKYYFIRETTLSQDTRIGGMSKPELVAHGVGHRLKSRLQG